MAVIDDVWYIVVELCGKSCGSELIIVTGRGRHSHNGIARLRPAVIAFLNAHHYQYVIISHFMTALRCCNGLAYSVTHS